MRRILAMFSAISFSLAYQWADTGTVPSILIVTGIMFGFWCLEEIIRETNKNK